MPIWNEHNYDPPMWLKNGQVNTMASALLRRPQPLPLKRNLIRTLDDDVVVIDRLAKGRTRLAVLCHGLEGGSDSSYIQTMGRALYQEGYDIIALNFRSCGGVMNRQLRMYHSGETSDLHMVLKYFQDAYQYIVLVGFSLGGNVVLKYLGQDPKKVHHKVRAAAAISVPVDLAGASDEIGKRKNYLYQEMFLRSLTKKVREKSKQFPEKVKLEHLGKVKSLRDFDEYYTSRMHGFNGAEDYYAQCNSLQFLFDIQLPTLLINSKDDPFLSPSCFPEKLAKYSDALFYHETKYGGHCGFRTGSGPDHHETVAKDFFKVHTPSLSNDLSWHL